MKNAALLLASLVLSFLLGGCGDKGSEADPPANFTVVAGDGGVTVTWTEEPDVDYWLFYGPGDSITPDNWLLSGGSVITKVRSPRVIGGLINGRTYSFSMNARKDGGPGGPATPTIVAVPTLAGANWAVGEPLGSGRLAGISTGNSAAGYANIAVGAGGTIYASVNSGATTTPANPAAPADLSAVWYGTIGFVAAGADGTLLFSSDATTWTRVSGGTTATLRGGTSFGTGGFVAVGDGGTIIGSSNGSDWIPAPSGTTETLYAAAFGNGRYVAVGANGTILTSTDGGTWTAAPSGTPVDLRGVSYAAQATTAADSTVTVTHLYVAVGAAGTVVTSNDGLAWTVLPPISANDLSAVVYGGQFVAVGKAGTIFTSTDAATWQARSSGTTRDLNAVARTLQGYSAVGDAGTVVSTF